MACPLMAFVPLKVFSVAYISHLGSLPKTNLNGNSHSDYTQECRHTAFYKSNVPFFFRAFSLAYLSQTYNGLPLTFSYMCRTCLIVCDSVTYFSLIPFPFLGTSLILHLWLCFLVCLFICEPRRTFLFFQNYI